MNREEDKFTEIKNKYKSFLVPCASIKVNNTSINAKLYIHIVNVDLTTKRDDNGTAYIRVTCVKYMSEDNNRKTLLEAFPLLEPIEISLGYNDKYTSVFKGIIYERKLSINFKFEAELDIYCVDKKALLRFNNAYSNYSSNKSLNDFVKEYIKKYGLKLSTDKDFDYHFDPPATFIQYGETDFDFIAEKAKEYGYEFFVLDETLYFRPLKSNRKNIITFDFSKEARIVLEEINFRPSLYQLYSAVKVKVYNQDADKEFEGESKINNENQTITGAKLLQNHSYELINLETLQLPNNLAVNPNQVAKQKLFENSMNFVEISVLVKGIPEITLGCSFSVEGVDSQIDNNYYIKEVRHSYIGNSYQTTIIGISNKIKLSKGVE